MGTKIGLNHSPSDILHMHKHSPFLLFFFWVAFGLIGCQENHLIKDPALWNHTQQDFNYAQSLPNEGLYQEVAQQKLPAMEYEGLIFLYAYMPFADAADHSISFYHRQVQLAIKARRELPWGKRVPDREFLYFVLPPRVGDAPLDTLRDYLYPLLHEEIKAHTMQEAAWEVNRWCNQFISFLANAPRLEAPLTTLQRGKGSRYAMAAFTVAAMRAMCLPARLVSVPTLSHIDRGDVWVEVWLDGEWQYLPKESGDDSYSPLIQQQAMFVETKAFGRYVGNPAEEVIPAPSQPYYATMINRTVRYTPTRPAAVVVKKSNGDPAEKALVHYCLYNNGLLQPIAVVPTNGSGYARLTTGLGDVILCATYQQGERYEIAWSRLDLEQRKPFILHLQPVEELPDTLDFELRPPVVSHTQAKNDLLINSCTPDITRSLPPFKPLAPFVSKLSREKELQQWAREQPIVQDTLADSLWVQQLFGTLSRFYIDTPYPTPLSPQKVMTYQRGDVTSIENTFFALAEAKGLQPVYRASKKAFEFKRLGVQCSFQEGGHWYFSPEGVGKRSRIVLRPPLDLLQAWHISLSKGEGAPQTQALFRTTYNQPNYSYPQDTLRVKAGTYYLVGGVRRPNNTVRTRLQRITCKPDSVQVFSFPYELLDRE